MQRRNRLFHAPGWKTPLLQRSRLRITADQCIKLRNTVSCLSLPCALEINISIVHDCSQCFSIFLCLGCSVPLFFFRIFWDFLMFSRISSVLFSDCLGFFLKFSRTAFKFMIIQIFEDSTALFLRFFDFVPTFVRLRCEMALLRPIRFRF